MAGRPPKPSALKLLNGSAKHDPQRVNHEEPRAAPLTAVPDAPAELTSQLAREAFAGIAADAVALGVLTAVDVRWVAATAAAFAEYLEAKDWHERSDAWRRYATGLGRLGLNPSERSKIHVAPPARVDPIAAFLTPRRRTG